MDDLLSSSPTLVSRRSPQSRTSHRSAPRLAFGRSASFAPESPVPFARAARRGRVPVSVREQQLVARLTSPLATASPAPAPATSPLTASPRGTSRTHPLQSVTTSGHELSSSSRFFTDESVALSTLSAALRDSALVRVEAQSALASLAASFDHDFPPGSMHRASASALMVKSSSVASRLSSACVNMESSAARCLNISHRGAADRESIILALEEELAQRDINVSAMVSITNRQCESMQIEARAAAQVMSREVALSESQVEALVARCEELGVSFDDARKQGVSHLLRVAISRLSHRELARGWSSWLGYHAQRVAMFRSAIARFRNVAMHASLRRWAATHPPMGAIRRAVRAWATCGHTLPSCDSLLLCPPVTIAAVFLLILLSERMLLSSPSIAAATPTVVAARHRSDHTSGALRS